MIVGPARMLDQGFPKSDFHPISGHIQGDPQMMSSRVPRNISAWPIDSSLGTIVGLPPKDPNDDEDDNEEDEEDDDDDEDEEPAVIREPDDC